MCCVHRLLNMTRWPKCFISWLIMILYLHVLTILVILSLVLLKFKSCLLSYAMTNGCRFSHCLRSWTTRIHSYSWSLWIRNISLATKVAFSGIGACAVTHAHFSFASKILIALFNFLKKMLLWYFLFYRLTPRVWCQMACWRIGANFWAAKVCAICLTLIWLMLSLGPKVLRTLLAIRLLLLRQFISICIWWWSLRQLRGLRQRQLSTRAFNLLFLWEVLVLSSTSISFNPGVRCGSSQRARGWLMNILNLEAWVRLRTFSGSRKGTRWSWLENHDSCRRSCLNWTSIWTIGDVGVLVRCGPHLLGKDVGAVLWQPFGCIWVDVLRGLSGLILVHVAALADIVPSSTWLSCDVRARCCLFA